jgi:hypothetical protein
MKLNILSGVSLEELNRKENLKIVIEVEQHRVAMGGTFNNNCFYCNEEVTIGEDSFSPNLLRIGIVDKILMHGNCLCKAYDNKESEVANYVIDIYEIERHIARCPRLTNTTNVCNDDCSNCYIGDIENL